MDQLIKAEPFLGSLALDPTLRGILGAISQSPKAFGSRKRRSRTSSQQFRHR
jgi:hypothetical protein